MFGKHLARCSICVRPKDEAGPLVEGPHHVYICNDCCIAASENAKYLYDGICSFCCLAVAKQGTVQKIVFQSNTNDSVRICDECLELITAIFELEGSRG